MLKNSFDDESIYFVSRRGIRRSTLFCFEEQKTVNAGENILSDENDVEIYNGC